MPQTPAYNWQDIPARHPRPGIIFSPVRDDYLPLVEYQRAAS